MAKLRLPWQKRNFEAMSATEIELWKSKIQTKIAKLRAHIDAVNPVLERKLQELREQLLRRG